MVPLPPDDVERSLFGLLCTGVVEFLQQPAREELSPEAIRLAVIEAWANLRTRSHFEVLGVGVSAAPEEIKAAYYRLARLFHPDMHHHPELWDLHDKLDEVFTRITVAYDVLSHPQRRLDYEGFLARAQSVTPSASGGTAWTPERALEDAQHFFEEGKHWEVIGLLHGALSQAEGRTREQMLLLKAKAHLKNRGGQRPAEEELRVLLQESPEHAEGHYLLGTIYEEAGLRKRAITEFQRALDCRPGYRDAESRLAQLGAAAPEPSPTRKRT